MTHTSMRGQLRAALTLTFILCAITGAIYPGIVTGLARVLFPAQANGSLLEDRGRVVGSALIGQPFSRPEYFHPRPSAAGAGYDGLASAGSNKGPTDRRLADTLLRARIDSAVSRGDVQRGTVPSDMVTASASGLDPDISPANAHAQSARVARARGIDAQAVDRLVDAHVTARQFGVLGEPRVNVLRLNLALDSLFPIGATRPATDRPATDRSSDAPLP